MAELGLIGGNELNDRPRACRGEKIPVDSEILVEPGGDPQKHEPLIGPRHCRRPNELDPSQSLSERGRR
jgi:hypothetical protein